jgi:hypothetical protein
MRKLLLVCLALFSAPAYAEECLYLTGTGDTLYIDEQDQWAEFKLDGQVFQCELGPNGEALVAYCDFGEVAISFHDYHTALSPIDVLGKVWEYKCFEPA